MDKLRVKSTSRSTANCSDVILRQTTTTRLIFRPMLLDNQANAAASVKGVFIYQRQRANASWEDCDTIPLSQLKGGEGYKLEMHSEELLKLHNALSDLYTLHAQQGVPRGQAEFIKVDSRLAALARMDRNDLRNLLQANKTLGSQLLGQLIIWATESTQSAALVQNLVTLPLSTLRTINGVVNLQSLKGALSLWSEHHANSDEEFWQSELTKNSFLLEHLFAWPIVIVKGKAYVGGKSIYNASGKIVDFLMQNRVTRNAVLIEIKTPTTKLLANASYRTNVFTPSDDLAGSMMQVLSYKQSLLREFESLTRDNRDELDACDPRCAIIIGSAQHELQDRWRRESFELFRAQCSSISIVTFDEMFSKTEQLVALLETTPESAQRKAASTVTKDDDDIPF